MRVIIAGSRTIKDKVVVAQAIQESMYDITEIISGGAGGVDHCGKVLGNEMGIPVRRYLPDWDRHGKAAGPIRNQVMAENADALILVWDGHSPGSKSMREIALSKKLLLYEKIVP